MRRPRRCPVYRRCPPAGRAGLQIDYLSTMYRLTPRPLGQIKDFCQTYMPCRRGSDDRAARGGHAREEGASAGVPTANARTDSRVNVMMAGCGRRQRYHREHPSQRNRRRKFLHFSAPLALRRSLLACARKRGTKLLFEERLATEQRFTLDELANAKIRSGAGQAPPELIAGDGARGSKPVACPPRERSSWARIGPRASPSIFSGIADKAASSSDPPRLRSALGFTRDRGLPFGSSVPFCRERLACGLDAITISGRLGHGSLAIMLRVHGHWFPNDWYRLQGSWRRALPKAPSQSGYGSGSPDHARR